MDFNEIVSAENEILIPDSTISHNDQFALKIWDECLQLIQAQVNSQSFKTWFVPIVPLRVEQKRLIVQVPSQFFFEWLEEHHSELLNQTVTQICGSEMIIDYIVSEEEMLSTAEQVSTTVETGIKNQNASFPLPTSPSVTIASQPHKPPVSSGLNPRYTFERYVKGESNQFAIAAALAVANNPGGTSFNPLVIYGGVGLGKTHLVHAIGNQVKQSGKTQNVLYISSEKFTVDFVDAIQKDSIAQFSNFYRNVDVLIVDDIQFFTGKEKTQDYFFHTFNALHQQGKQIILSCDRSLKELKGVNDRLISRFQWGLTTDIQPPDLETRIAILKKKSAAENVDLPHEVLEFIASNVTNNIRELEGCLIGLLARTSLENRKIDLDIAKEVLRSVVGEFREHVTIEDIQRMVCTHLSIPEDLIRGKTRKQEIVNARQIAMYLAKELTNSSLKTIGLHFGGRDHSTVIHAYQTVEDALKSDPRQKQVVLQLRSKLENKLL